MDFAPSPRAAELLQTLRTFMDEHVLPAEAVYAEQRAALTGAGRGNDMPEIVEDLKRRARSLGLWNLFLPAVSSLTLTDYAPLAELTGRSIEIAPEALNCAAPDTGNMELLHMFGTPAQQTEWLEPLLEGTIRSAFAMTEPEVASSDARNIRTSITRDGDDYVVNGRKWWTTGALDPRCTLLIVMGRTDPDADPYRQQSMILVPIETPGVEVVRGLPVFGYFDQHGHAEVLFTDVRVPAENLLAGEGDGFRLAQERLGPGRVHHCMRAIGIAERALELMCRRAATREAFGQPLARQGVVQQQIAMSRIAIDQARLLVLQTAWLIDTVGAKAARTQVAAIKAVVPQMACDVVDRAIQVHGGMGVSDDVPLAAMYAGLRTLGIADGPDEVHFRSVARAELGRYLGAG